MTTNLFRLTPNPDGSFSIGAEDSPSAIPVTLGTPTDRQVLAYQAGSESYTPTSLTAYDVGVRDAITVPLSDSNVTVISAGTSKFIFRMPWGLELTEVRASLGTVSSSGAVVVDINENGTSILGTKLSIDATEKSSKTAATAAVISDAILADDAEITFDIDSAGTGAKGLLVTIIGFRV